MLWFLFEQLLSIVTSIAAFLLLPPLDVCLIAVAVFVVTSVCVVIVCLIVVVAIAAVLLLLLSLFLSIVAN